MDELCCLQDYRPGFLLKLLQYMGVLMTELAILAIPYKKKIHVNTSAKKNKELVYVF